MNRIQQEAQAKAMNMSREEMAKMLLQQEMNKGLSEDALNDAQKATLEDMKRVDAQEKFATAIAKLQQALSPIVGFFADILSNSVVIYSIMGVALVSKIPALVGGFKSFKDNLSSGFDSIKGIAKGVKDLVKGGGGKAAGGAISSKVPGLDKGAKSIADSADKTKGIDPKQGSGIKQFLKGLGDGLASIGQQAGNVIKGGLALGGALLAMGAGFALSLPLIAGSDPVLMLAFAGSLSVIGLTVAAMGKVGGDIIKGALAMGIMAVALIPAAYAFSLLAGVDAASILAFSLAIPILGLSVMALGLIFTNPITMFLFGAGVLGLLALGVAITPLAAAFGKLGDADIAGTMAGISQLASIAPGLSIAASGLYDLAGGLAAVGVAGVLALPVLKTLMSTGLLGGGTTEGGNEKEDGMEKVNKNLEKLISLVEAGGDVIILIFLSFYLLFPSHLLFHFLPQLFLLQVILYSLMFLIRVVLKHLQPLQQLNLLLNHINLKLLLIILGLWMLIEKYQPLCQLYLHLLIYQMQLLKELLLPLKLIILKHQLQIRT
jgi:hypothetical protein